MFQSPPALTGTVFPPFYHSCSLLSIRNFDGLKTTIARAIKPATTSPEHIIVSDSVTVTFKNSNAINRY